MILKMIEGSVDKKWQVIPKREFLAYPAIEKFLALLSDGVCYTVEKLAKASQEDVSVCSEWLKRKADEGLLILNKVGTVETYRMSFETLSLYRYSRNIPLDAIIASGQYNPRVWGGLTEAEAFAKAPLREVSSFIVFLDDKYFQELKELLKFYGSVSQISINKYRVYAMGKAFITRRIEDYFTSRNIPVKVSAKNNTFRRETIELDPKFYDGFVLWYTDFANVLSRSAVDTIKTFYKSEWEDIRTQIVIWVLQAIEKYDDNKGVPFSGYLSNVLQRWPYNFPIEVLGSDVAHYQRLRKKVKNANDGVVCFDTIASLMNKTLEEVLVLEEQHQTWLSIHFIDSLEKSIESSNGVERVVESKVFDDKNGKSSIDRLIDTHNLTHAILKTAVTVPNSDSIAYKLLGELTESKNMSKVVDSISDEFRAAFIDIYGKVCEQTDNDCENIVYLLGED